MIRPACYWGTTFEDTPNGPNGLIKTPIVQDPKWSTSPIVPDGVLSVEIDIKKIEVTVKWDAGEKKKMTQKDRARSCQSEKRGSKPRHICITHHIGSTPPPPGIRRRKGQWRGKGFLLMTSSWSNRNRLHYSHYKHAHIHTCNHTKIKNKVK